MWVGEARNRAIEKARVHIVAGGVVAVRGRLPILLVARLGPGGAEPTRCRALVALAAEGVDGCSGGYELRGARPPGTLEILAILGLGEFGQLATDAPDLLVGLSAVQPGAAIGSEELVVVLWMLGVMSSIVLVLGLWLGMGMGMGMGMMRVVLGMLWVVLWVL